MIKVLAVALALATIPACAQAQGLVGDVVGGALGTADTAAHDVLGTPRRGYYRHGYYGHRHGRCIDRHGRRYCR